jgi:hypothetical protein
MLSTGVHKMGITTVLNVFKNSSLITPQGEFKISRIFPSGRAANKAQYYYYRTENGAALYIRRSNTGKNKFVVVGK